MLSCGRRRRQPEAQGAARKAEPRNMLANSALAPDDGAALDALAEAEQRRLIDTIDALLRDA